MDLKDIKKIVELMDEHGLTHFKLKQDDSKLELSKKADIDIEALQRIMASTPVASAAQSPATSAPASSVENGDEGGDGPPAGEVEITSELVGTFYRSPSPDSDPFIQVGSEIEEESTVCIIEAMKVMNEIHAGVRGSITKVLVDNGTPVQYGEPLFYVKPA